MNEIAEDNKRKPKLTVEEQIEHLKSKGVTFELCDEGEASRILSEQDHYFRLAAYRVLFPKRVGGKHDGEYAELDFGQLVDLAGIDQELRRFLLPLTLDVENAAKTKLVEKITDNRNEDGYSVLADYLTHLNHAERNRREGEISRLENDAYLGPLVERYPLDEMPAWVFLELSSFGAFASFYLFCANRWGDTEMRDDHYLLRRANSLRNAAAHSSAIINGLGISSATSTRYPASVAKALGDAGVSKRLRRPRCAIRECSRRRCSPMPATVSSPEKGRREHTTDSWHLGNVQRRTRIGTGGTRLSSRHTTFCQRSSRHG